MQGQSCVFASSFFSASFDDLHDSFSKELAILTSLLKKREKNRLDLKISGVLFQCIEVVLLACVWGKTSLYFGSCLFPMSTVSERKHYRSLADVTHRSGVPAADVQGYNQLGFEGLDHEEQQEVTIENLKVVKLPQVKKIGGSYEWSCSVTYEVDLWHQENYGEFVLHALHNADAAIALRMKPNDLLSVRGVAWEQHIDLRGGKRKTIHHVNVTDLVIQKRSPVQKATRRQ